MTAEAPAGRKVCPDCDLDLSHDGQHWTAPAGRTGDSGSEVKHQHRWSPWRQVGVAFDYLGDEVQHAIVEVNGDPVTPGWSRRCACGDVEANTLGKREVPRPKPWPSQTAEERLAAVLALHVPITETQGAAFVRLCRECSTVLVATGYPCPTALAAGAS